MILYNAGLYTANFAKTQKAYRGTTDNVRALRDYCCNHLESYHYIHKGKYVERMTRDGVKCFLDSGAFSAFTQGIEVDIDKYAEFIHTNKHVIEFASVLDGIGDADLTWQNQKILEAKGCDVLPCFHYGEPFEVAEYYSKNYPYMTIGGMVPVSNKALVPWLDHLWDEWLTDKDGISRTKVHGFGLTSLKLMTKYPWYSVDSSSWVQTSGSGSILFPEWDTVIPVSSRSSARRKMGGHWWTYPESTRKKIKDLLEYYGLEVDGYHGVENDYVARWAINAFSFQRRAEALGDDHWKKPFKAQQRVLFDA